MFNILFNTVKTIFGTEFANFLLCDNINQKSQEHLQAFLVSRDSLDEHK